MPVWVGSSEGLGSTACGEQSRCEKAKHTGIALSNLQVMRQRDELTQEPRSPPPSPEVNEGRAFRVAAAPRTD